MDIRTAKVSSKGQIFLPVDIRKELNIEAGQELVVELQDGKIVLTPKVKLADLRGIDTKDG